MNYMICGSKKANSNTQSWNKVSTNIIINSFDVCGITTDDETKILCLHNEQNEADDEEVAGNLNDIINDFDSSDDECVSRI